MQIRIYIISNLQYISPEEVKRLEELKRAEEERLRANQDDSRERALQEMMGGRLEDRYSRKVLHAMMMTWIVLRKSKRKS